MKSEKGTKGDSAALSGLKGWGANQFRGLTPPAKICRPFGPAWMPGQARHDTEWGGRCGGKCADFGLAFLGKYGIMLCLSGR
jgi:hypothetical protein